MLDIGTTLLTAKKKLQGDDIGDITIRKQLWAIGD